MAAFAAGPVAESRYERHRREKRWMHDAETKACLQCSAPFPDVGLGAMLQIGAMHERRHHCRW